LTVLSSKKVGEWLVVVVDDAVLGREVSEWEEEPLEKDEEDDDNDEGEGASEP
jgi:hypothetical protein